MPSELFHRFDGRAQIAHLLVGSDEDALLTLRGKPALIRLPGEDASLPPRLVVTLLHGNEDSGFRALRALLAEGVTPRSATLCFIGNPRAATQDGWFAHRFLDDQEDFNRVWGRTPRTTRMRRAAAELLDELAEEQLQAAIDVHNNTGENPPYAIIPTPTDEAFDLAARVAPRVLLWRLRVHALMEALQPSCPTAAVECGQSGRAESTAFARRAIEAFLAADLSGPPTRRPAEVFDMLARVRVRDEVPFAFGGVLDERVDLVLRPGLDGANFGMLLAGTELGRVHPGTDLPLEALDMRSRDVAARFFTIHPDGAVVVAEDLTPVMMTTTVKQTRQDCLFYLSRRLT